MVVQVCLGSSARIAFGVALITGVVGVALVRVVAQVSLVSSAGVAFSSTARHAGNSYSSKMVKLSQPAVYKCLPMQPHSDTLTTYSYYQAS